MERAGIVLGDHGALEGGLNQLKLLERHACDATMLGVLDGLSDGVSVGGADDTDRIGPVGLDFEV